MKHKTLSKDDRQVLIQHITNFLISKGSIDIFLSTTFSDQNTNDIGNVLPLNSKVEDTATTILDRVVQLDNQYATRTVLAELITAMSKSVGYEDQVALSKIISGYNLIPAAPTHAPSKDPAPDAIAQRLAATHNRQGLLDLCLRFGIDQKSIGYQGSAVSLALVIVNHSKENGRFEELVRYAMET
jgi:hypothetical protein